MKATWVTILTALSLAVTAPAWSGGETAGRDSRAAVPSTSRLPLNPLRPGAFLPKSAPSPAPYRPVGWGFNCHEAYGPTYYYPSEKSYEGLHPQYYPFFHPRLWPNYKADALPGGQCGSSRSCWHWDSYDDWMRGARYGEKQ